MGMVSDGATDSNITERVGVSDEAGPSKDIRNVADRMRFAKHLRSGHNDRWEKVEDFIVLTDESTIPLHPIPNRQNTRKRSDDPDNARFT